MRSEPVRILAFCLALLATAGLQIMNAVTADPAHVAQIKSTGSCAGCNLAGEDLSGLLAQGDLSHANFAGAKLYRALLQGAVLFGASFNGADLSGANLEGALDADLTGAITDDKTTCPSGAKGPCN